MKFEGQPGFKVESETEIKPYNFPELGELEEPMTELVLRLKEKIDKGNFDVLISDDAGGRIPSLIMRKILKMTGEVKNIPTFFISARNDEKAWAELEPLLTELKERDARPLIVTQFAYSGQTLNTFARHFSEKGLPVEVIAINTGVLGEIDYNLIEPDINLFYPKEWRRLVTDERHEKYSGVKSINKAGRGPFPTRLDKAVEIEGRKISDEKMDELAGIEPTDLYIEKRDKILSGETLRKVEEYKRVQLTEEEKREIQNNINLAREDVDIIANNIFNKVWGSVSE